MQAIIVLLSTLALATAANLLPIDQSIVNVKSERNGQDYSYSIHENRGFAIPVQPVISQPTVKIIQHEIHHDNAHHQPIETQQNKQLNAHEQTKEAKAFSDLTYINSIPLSMPYAYSYQLPNSMFYSIPGYQYAYAYPYMYHMNYNLIPIKE